MIRFRLKQLIADREYSEGRRITLDEISSATGIHRTTLSKIANNRNPNTTLDVLDKICAYFDVSLSDVAERVPSE